MPRGRKAQAPESAPPSASSGDEQVVDAPLMSSSGATSSNRPKAVKKGRGETQANLNPSAIPEPSENVKKGRGRGKKTAAVETPQVDSVAEKSETAKKGRGRARKDTAVVDEPTEPSEVDSVPAAAPIVKETTKPRGTARNKNIVKESVSVEEKKKGRGRKATESEEPAAAEEAVVGEKKKRGGRPKKVSNEEKDNAQAVMNQQPEDDVTEAETAPPVSKKGRSKKTPQKSKDEEHMEVALNDEDENVEKSVATTVDSKKKGGRGRKAATAAEPEFDKKDDASTLPVSSANVEIRKGRGTPRAVTPAPPITPTQVDSVEEKKVRGRQRKDPVLTPRETGTDTVQAVKEEPAKRNVRSKKPSEPEMEEDEVGSPSAAPKERKRKVGVTQSQIVKKSMKQK